MTKKCSIEDCLRGAKSRDWCYKHYMRWRRHGDPNIVGQLRIAGESHNLKHTPEYRAWVHLKERCLNKNHKQYTNYGGRGVKVCDRWRCSFLTFYKDMGKKPTPSHSIDRINNDGNYEPSNCRWATKTQQILNRRGLKTNTSGFRGVTWDKHNKGWRAQTSVSRRTKHLGLFNGPNDASQAYEKFMLKRMEAIS